MDSHAAPPARLLALIAGAFLPAAAFAIPPVFDFTGSADAQAYYGQLEPGFEYRRVTYLPSVSKGKYLANPATVAVNSIVKNTDLPNLRGEYLRGYLAELYPAKPAMMLEGIVTKKDNPAARNTELILYVAW